ncbi:NYN domain-containing protein [bacterium]|nr:NYN domain-containing protein [bacterium]
MSLHYIIDGYNVIKQVTYLSGLKLKNGRDSLISILEKHRPQGSLKNKVTIVFDGKDNTFISHNISSASLIKTNSNINVIFSKNETADDKIKRIARKAINPKILIVITDDKEILYFLRSYGIKTQSVKQFLKPISKKNKFIKKSQHFTSQKKPILSSEKAVEITRELKKIWDKN